MVACTLTKMTYVMVTPAIVKGTRFSTPMGVALHIKNRVPLTLYEALWLKAPGFEKPTFQNRVPLTLYGALWLKAPSFQKPIWVFQNRVPLTLFEAPGLKAPSFQTGFFKIGCL